MHTTSHLHPLTRTRSSARNAPSPGDSDTTTASHQAAATAIGGVILLVVSTMLHPVPSDPSDLTAALTEYAGDRLWMWSHLGQFLGVAAMAAALVMLAATFDPGPEGTLARVAAAGAAVTAAAAAALQAVDGVALNAMAKHWIAASEPARRSAYDAAFAVREIEIGLASLLLLVVGLTVVLLGIAMLISARHPSWLATLGLLAGLGAVAAAATQGTAGFSPHAMTLSMSATAALLLWVVLVGLLMGRWARPLARQGPAR